MLLDTNVVSAFLKGKPPHVHQFVETLLQSQNLTVSFVTQYELRRGIEALALRGEGRRRKVQLLKFLESCEVLGLDVGHGGGWNEAATLWARAQAHKPSIVIEDADLLIASTAATHGQTLVTCDVSLAANLQAIGVAVQVLESRSGS